MYVYMKGEWEIAILIRTKIVNKDISFVLRFNLSGTS